MMTAAQSERQAVQVVADTVKGIVTGFAEIDASPERVFRALTTEEQSEWWGHEGMYRTHDYVIDLRPGGKWSFKATAVDGTVTTVGGRYITIEPPRLLEYTWAPSWDNFEESRVRIEIEPRGKGSLLTLVHTGFARREKSAAGHADGWTRVLGWMATWVSTRE